MLQRRTWLGLALGLTLGPWPGESAHAAAVPDALTTLIPPPYQAQALTPEETPHFTRRKPYREGDHLVWEYRLVVTETKHPLADGTPYKVYAYGNRVPAPQLYARDGDRVRIRLVNETTVPHTIHSHGLYTPQRMDGATHVHLGPDGEMHQHDPAGAPLPVAPGEEFTYDYIARPSGSHFYHCHVSANEHMARGMIGTFVVFPKLPEPPADFDSVLLLQEWNSKYAKQGKPGDPREVGDADFFTFNGLSFPNTPLMQVKQGARVRIRFVNAGAQPHFMHLHGHTFLVTHKDGFPLREPMLMDTVAVGPAERVDIFFIANNPGDWPLHCHSPPHTTNAGVYPGGMMAHLIVGPDRYPKSGEGPLGPGIEAATDAWRDYARRYYASLAKAAR
ncbi:multicopper oxidase domain-containing protein [Ideonella azotifigens]|uniref:Copper oxidase n=1 Tax=Ideonella azotifigens TaxID=513160 RepID=A0ABP3VBR3_9BURK|nr:multicopper oxidase domain-containing protein [Ideonella azotifigens]MCD2342608.1 multicopper oxidase domain-containing protein [Ideonella azotifigens]